MLADGTRPDVSHRMDLLVLCSGNPYADTKVADQHMAEQLAGFRPVLYVDPPVSVVRALMARAWSTHVWPRRPVEILPNLWRTTPLVEPYPGRSVTVDGTARLLVAQIERAVRLLGHAVYDLVTTWPLYNVFASRGALSRVYWAQDDYVGLAEIHGQDPRLVAAKDTEIVDAADVVIASNPLVADAHATPDRDVRLIPFGCDAEGFESDGPCAADVHLPRPALGVIGRFNSRTDLDLLFAVADRGRLLLVGPVDRAFDTARFRRLVELPSVQWVGAKPYGDIPAYYRCIDVGLVAYVDTVFNRGSFPLKLLEYLAAGLPVVSTELPATRWLDTDLIRTASDERGFVEAVDRALQEGADPTMVERRRAFAREHSWRSRALSLDKVAVQSRIRVD